MHIVVQHMRVQSCCRLVPTRASRPFEGLDIQWTQWLSRIAHQSHRDLGAPILVSTLCLTLYSQFRCSMVLLFCWTSSVGHLGSRRHWISYSRSTRSDKLYNWLRWHWSMNSVYMEWMPTVWCPVEDLRRTLVPWTVGHLWRTNRCSHFHHTLPASQAAWSFAREMRGRESLLDMS